MAISQNFPNTRPSLNLNFARSKTLDPRITFIRTTTGTRVGPDGLIEVIPADQPRFDFDPVTGECLGLIIEEERTNLAFYSTYHAPDGTEEDFRWKPLNGAVNVSTTELAPDGTNTAWRWSGNSGGGGVGAIARVYFPGETSITANGTDSYTVSFYAKLVSGTTGIARFDFQDSHLIKIYTDQLTQNPNKWVRIITSGVLPSGTYNFLDLINNTTSDFVIDFWGLQIEKDKDVSSYIPTSGSTFTRASDNVYMTDISDFFNPNEGTAVITYRPRFNGVYNTQHEALFAFKSPAGRRIGFDGNSNSGQLYFIDYNNILSNDGGKFTWVHSGSQPNSNVSDRVLVSYANTYFRMYSNANPFYSTNTIYGNGKIEDYIPSSVGISTLGFNTLSFGHESTGNTLLKFNQTLQQFIYYPSEVGVSNAKTLSKKP